MENQYKHTADDMEINLWDLLRVLAKKLPVIVAVGILTALIAFGIGEFAMAPIYSSTTKIYVLNKQENSSITYSDLQMGMQLTKDYAELIQSRPVLEEVIENMGLPMGYEKLREMVSVSTLEDTRILSITVSDTDPARAMNIANAVRDAASVHITNVMDIEAVNVAETAYMPTSKSEPNVARMTTFGGCLGILLVAGIVVIRFIMDDTIKNAEDVEKYLGLSTLALIPNNEGEKKGKKKKRKK